VAKKMQKKFEFSWKNQSKASETAESILLNNIIKSLCIRLQIQNESLKTDFCLLS
jgi:hypothetical protein